MVEAVTGVGALPPLPQQFGDAGEVVIVVFGHEKEEIHDTHRLL